MRLILNTSKKKARTNKAQQNGLQNNLFFGILTNFQILPIMNFKILKISYLFANKKVVPKINISGLWLKNAGFEIGKSVKIEVSENQIIIRNANQNI